MEISVVYEGKKYKFCDVGPSKKWVDNKNIVVPMIMNDVLRRQAIKEGANPEDFFIKEPKPTATTGYNNSAKVKSRKRNGSVIGGINLSTLIKNVGEDDE